MTNTNNQLISNSDYDLYIDPNLNSGSPQVKDKMIEVS